MPATIATSRSAGCRRGAGASRAGSASPSAASRPYRPHQPVLGPAPAPAGQGGIHGPHHLAPGPFRPQPAHYGQPLIEARQQVRQIGGGPGGRDLADGGGVTRAEPGIAADPAARPWPP